MSVRRVTPNIKAERLDESHQFYVEVLGLDLKMDLGWIATYVSAANPTAQVSVIVGRAPVLRPRPQRQGHQRNDAHQGGVDSSDWPCGQNPAESPKAADAPETREALSLGEQRSDLQGQFS